MGLNQLDRAVQQLFIQLRHRTIQQMNQPYQVSTKTSANDLVTTVDQNNEEFIRAQLSRLDPDGRIIGEEEAYQHEIDQNLNGRVWIIDPIDGTLNFVLQHNHFAIMLALYIDGQPQLGYILDVMNNKLYHCRIGHGAYCDDQQLLVTAQQPLANSLVDINRSLLLNNVADVQRVAEQAAGLRMYGSAGIELIHVITGQLGAYISRLKPWDLAAGRVFADELGLVVKTIDDKPLNVLSSNTVLVATKQVCHDIWRLIK